MHAVMVRRAREQEKRKADLAQALRDELTDVIEVRHVSAHFLQQLVHQFGRHLIDAARLVVIVSSGAYDLVAADVHGVGETAALQSIYRRADRPIGDVFAPVVVAQGDDAKLARLDMMTRY